MYAVCVCVHVYMCVRVCLCVHTCVTLTAKYMLVNIADTHEPQVSLCGTTADFVLQVLTLLGVAIKVACYQLGPLPILCSLDVMFVFHYTLAHSSACTA